MDRKPRAGSGVSRISLSRGNQRAVLLVLSLLVTSLPFTGQARASPLTWSPETTVPTQYPDVGNLHPSAAVAPNGSIWLVFDSLPPVTVSNTPRIIMKQTLPGSPDLTWSNDVNVSMNPGAQPDTSPRIINLANGTMMITWARAGRDPGLYYRLNNGGIWSSEARLTYSPGIDNFPSVVQDQKGTIWMVWERRNPESVVYDTNNNGIYDSGEPVIVGTGLVSGAVLKIDPKLKFVNATNNPSETWTPGKTVAYDTNNNGIYDTGEPIIAGATPPAGTRLQSDSKVKYFDANNDNVWDYLPAAIYYKTFHGSWSSDVQLTFDPLFNQRPDATLTHDGRVWVVWQSNRINSQFDIFYKTFNGTAWSTDKLLFNDVSTDCAAVHPVGCDDLGPSILQDSNGTIQIFWSRAQPSAVSSTAFPGEIFTISSTDNGLTFPIINMQRLTSNNQLTQCPPSVPCTVTAQADSSPTVVEFNHRLWVFWSRPNSTVPEEINLLYIPSEPIFTHHVAITSIIRPDTATWNTTIQLTIAVTNKGDFPENATVNWTIGTVASGTCPIPFSLQPGETKNCPVQLKYENTSVLSPGRYNVTASAIIPQEPLGNLPDSILNSGKIALLPPGDMDANGDVTLLDAIIWIQSYGSSPGSSNWNPNADLNGDGIVNFADAVMLSRWFGTRI